MNPIDILKKILVSGGGTPAIEDLHPKYVKYAADTMANGQAPLQWADWLKTQGFMLGPNNMPIPMPQPQQPAPQPQAMIGTGGLRG